MDAPSSTWFTAHPEWHWLVVSYFVLGALAGGSLFLAALIDLAGRPADRVLARRAYYVVLPMVIAIGVVLLLDLSRPDRFWHLFLRNHTWVPIMKPWSPISVASWVLPVFGLLAFLSLLGALADGGRLRWSWARRLRPPGAIGTLVAVPSAIVGLYFAAYPGVLLAVTNRPIWSDTPLIGMLFVVSAVAMSAALMVLLAGRNRETVAGARALHRTSLWSIGVQFLVLAAVLATLGGVLRAWLNGWGMLLVFGVIGVGMVAPVLLARRREWLGAHNLAVSALLVIAGGFMLRTLIVLSPEAIGS